MRRVGTAALVLGWGLTLAGLSPGGSGQSAAGSGTQSQPQQGQPQLPLGGTGSEPHSRIATHVLPPAGPLTIRFGDRTAVWTPEKLAALPHTTVTVYNAHSKVSQTYSGVPVNDLLTPLGVPANPRGRDLERYLVAEGSDGYKVVYSISEVNPDVHDAMVIVADTLEGKPIAGTGPLQLIATRERRPARWVRNLVAIRVQDAP